MNWLYRVAFGKEKEILIIGAGSTGLSSALFLSENGFKPRIIDKRKTHHKITKALGVNPNTLKLLEKTEVTKRFLENGWKLTCMNIWSNGKKIYRNDYGKIKHPYPFMLIQPQCDTESIIEEALTSRNIYVERGCEIESVMSQGKNTLIKFSEEGVTEEFTGPVLAADGSSSKIRQGCNVDFRGWEHKEVFRLYDIELETPVTHKEGHYMLFADGGMIMLHIRDGIWRVGGNFKDVFNYLPKGTKTGQVSWETSFTVQERVASRFSIGNIFLLGDAAHIHSPAGAKGMNLCIEDSYIFSNLVNENKEHLWDKIRRPKIKRTVGIIGQLTDKIGGRNVIGKTVRNNLGKLTPFFPLFMPKLRKFLLGLK